MLSDMTRKSLRNKNAVVGDKSAVSPGGVRIGAPAMTSRGLKEADFVKVGEFLHRGIQFALEVQKASGKKLADFLKAIDEKANADELAVPEHELSSHAPVVLCPLASPVVPLEGETR